MELSKEEIIRMAREAGVYLTKIGYEFDTDDLCRFAAIVAANEREKWEQALPIAMDAMMLQEREACAKVCEEQSPLDAMVDEEFGSAAMVRVADAMAKLNATAIRARGEK